MQTKQMKRRYKKIGFSPVESRETRPPSHGIGAVIQVGRRGTTVPICRQTENRDDGPIRRRTDHRSRGWNRRAREASREPDPPGHGPAPHPFVSTGTITEGVGEGASFEWKRLNKIMCNNTRTATLSHFFVQCI